MSEQQQEYDRFGPWAVEISAEDPPPPLFVPYLTRSEPALLCVKIPRPIARRDAHPGMDLYDYLVCLYADDMTILQRQRQGVRTVTFRYREVQRLRVDAHLLRGNLHLGLPGRPYDLLYNTVGQDLMLRIVELVRQRYVGPHSGPVLLPDTTPTVREGELSFLFERLLAEEQRSTGMRLLAAQGTTAVTSEGLGTARRLLFRIADKRLLESMHLTDGRELKVVGRGYTYAYRWQAIYGTDTTYLPIDNLTDVAWEDDAPDAATNLVLRTSGGSSVHAFTRDNPSIDAYTVFLSSLPHLAPQAADAAARSHPA
jgi:hypothetical protein